MSAGLAIIIIIAGKEFTQNKFGAVTLVLILTNGYVHMYLHLIRFKYVVCG